MINVIMLDIDDNLTHLAGREFAERICETQVINKLMINMRNVVVFNERIKFMTESFIEQFKYTLLKSGKATNIELLCLNEVFKSKVEGLYPLEIFRLDNFVIKECPICGEKHKLVQSIKHNIDMGLCRKCGFIMLFGLYDNPNKALVGVTITGEEFR